ncbi:hypothetical protein P9D80_03215 [Bacillus spizizenii]|uniref:hypothetical protein n=1 Tax=Bacillus spizizenii TaxID=96241 RepID=UPI002DBEE699|nr:hypothetical protein [Bacillus spizizenii]MEC1584374.1 hypothetical protein [Bacillus spizizenii]
MVVQTQNNDIELIKAAKRRLLEEKIKTLKKSASIARYERDKNILINKIAIAEIQDFEEKIKPEGAVKNRYLPDNRIEILYKQLEDHHNKRPDSIYAKIELYENELNSL